MEHGRKLILTSRKDEEVDETGFARVAIRRHVLLEKPRDRKKRAAGRQVVALAADNRVRRNLVEGNKRVAPQHRRGRRRERCSIRATQPRNKWLLQHSVDLRQ